jgi:hypothetical protein
LGWRIRLVRSGENGLFGSAEHPAQPNGSRDRSQGRCVAFRLYCDKPGGDDLPAGAGGTLDEYRIRSDGTLDRIGVVTGLPVGQEGVAAN